MARYIDADALYKKLYPLDLADKRKYTINAKAVADAIANIPTADVVPRAEVDTLQAEIRGWQVKSQYDTEHFTADIKVLQAENATLIKRQEELLQSYSVSISRQILAEIREAYEKYGGAYGMLQKINELEVRFGVRERDCRDCRCFVGCEAARGGRVCDGFDNIQNAELRVVEVPTPTKEN